MVAPRDLVPILLTQGPPDGNPAHMMTIVAAALRLGVFAGDGVTVTALTTSPAIRMPCRETQKKGSLMLSHKASWSCPISVSGGDTGQVVASVNRKQVQRGGSVALCNGSRGWGKLVYPPSSVAAIGNLR